MLQRVCSESFDNLSCKLFICVNFFVLDYFSRFVWLIFIPNRTFLVRFGGISGEFGRAMVPRRGSYFYETKSNQNIHGETKQA